MAHLQHEQRARDEGYCECHGGKGYGKDPAREVHHPRRRRTRSFGQAVEPASVGNAEIGFNLNQRNSGTILRLRGSVSSSRASIAWYAKVGTAPERRKSGQAV